jgi:hypothetical protein
MLSSAHPQNSIPKQNVSFTITDFVFLLNFVFIFNIFGLFLITWKNPNLHNNKNVSDKYKGKGILRQKS